MDAEREAKSIRATIWLSRIIRWVLGCIFLAIGIAYIKEDGWPVMLFGVVMIVTGFFSPKRCIGGTCDMPVKTKQ